jgi:glyoxylase-like metal-dependent hydrolase (beta-lactamase superfamily II)
MVHIRRFEFSPFQENTYVISNEARDCWIIDPGCYDASEKQALKAFIAEEGLTPVRLLNTHCHLDHVFGNAFVCETYGLRPSYHRKDQPTMEMAGLSAKMYGIPGFEPSPNPVEYIDEDEVLTLGGESFELRFCPGHAPGHLVLVHHGQKFVIGGDVLFNGSIGRTDLPGGNHETLLRSIREQLYTLDDDYTVYSGHGPTTTIGKEKKTNPFVRSSDE